MIDLGELHMLFSAVVADILDGSGKDANEKMTISANLDRDLKRLASAIIERAVKEALHAVSKK
jgi:hypothetical protein